MPIKDMPTHLKPREKALMHGLEMLSEIELLAIILRNGTSKKDALDLSKELINTFGGMKYIFDAPLEKLLTVKGIGPVKALELLAIKQVILQLNSLPYSNQITSNEQIIELAHSKIFDFTREVFIIFLLDHFNKLIYFENRYKGASGGLSISPKEIASLAITKNAPKIICLHNHPSGDTTPSVADIATTKQLSYICTLLGVTLVKHLVINEKKDYQLVSW